jgi:hypothetical protein
MSRGTFVQRAIPQVADMFARVVVSIVTPALFLFVLAPTETARPPAQAGSNSQQAGSSRPPTDVANYEHPTEAQIRERTQRLLANQHRDDEAMDQYERVERRIDYTSGPNPRTVDDKTYRVVPTGGGTLKILVKNGEVQADPNDYHQQLLLWESILQMMSQPDSSKAKSAYEKYDKRKRERAQFVDAAASAYVAKWVRRETYNNRVCDVFELDPNPQFHPHSMFQDAFSHIAAKAWVDHDQDQIVHAEGRVLSDISFGGGILGKLYKGGFVSMDQAEVTPGIWLATRYEYDFSGRKFFFSFDEHQITYASHYRRVGTPQEALALVQNELAGRKPFIEDP